MKKLPILFLMMMMSSAFAQTNHVLTAEADSLAQKENDNENTPQ